MINLCTRDKVALLLCILEPIMKLNPNIIAALLIIMNFNMSHYMHVLHAECPNQSLTFARST